MSGQTSLTEEVGGGGAGGLARLRARLDSLYRAVQYEPWFVKVSLLDRRLLVALLLCPLLLLLIILSLAATLGGNSDCQAGLGAEYRGPATTTRAGLVCVEWDLLDPATHTVTPNRYPAAGLAGHSSCRNPDHSAGGVWCYTSTKHNTFDYCAVPRCETDPVAAGVAAPPDPDRDQACPHNVTLVGSPGGKDGLYSMTAAWVGGRGVYRGEDRLGNWCLSWHGRYRHWWLGRCSTAGHNAGLGWLEEDARCPDQGGVWRQGGTDALLRGMRVLVGGCLQYSTEWRGALVSGPLADTQITSSMADCQALCLTSHACISFVWRADTKRCRLLATVTSAAPSLYSVSGKPLCSEKGE